MDRRYNDYNRFGRAFERDDFDSRRPRSDGFNRDKFRRMVDEARGRSRAGSDDFRDSFRGNLGGFRDGLREKSEEKPRANDRRDDSDNFTEEFHERQVDYHKDVRTKDSDDDARGEGF